MDDDLYDDNWPEREADPKEPSEEGTGAPTEPAAVEEPAWEPGAEPESEPGQTEPAVPDEPQPWEPDEAPAFEPLPVPEEPLPGADAEEPAGGPPQDALWDHRPFEEEMGLLSEQPEGETVADQPEGELIAEHPEVPHVSHLGEGVVLLGEPEVPADQTAILNTDGSVLAAPAPAAQAELSEYGVDLGPERRGNAWVWIGLVAGVLLMAGALGYAWWYFNIRPIEVPNVVGRLPAQAAQALNDAGLRLGKVTEAATDTAPPGTVIQQFPESDTSIKPGEAVSLVLAGSPEMSKVPEVLGVSLSEAARVLANARLAPQVVESYSPTTPVGFVQSQAPSSGVELEPGSVVALIVSKGTAPASFRMPKIVGLAEADAGALLGMIEVRAEAYRSFDNSQPVGMVVAQTPLQETQVPFDGVVLYLVSKGPGSSGVTVPDVVGQTSDQAGKRLKTAGLKSKISTQASSQVPKGEVIAQMPQARDKTSAGETVGLVVSAGTSSQTSVPDIAGQTADEASKNLVGAGYRAIKFEVRTTVQTTGRVYLQLPAAGTPWPQRYPVMMLLAAP